MNNIAKLFIISGIIFILIGFFLFFIKKLPFNLGRLPGDITIKKENFTFYFPIVTSIILSIILSLIFWIISKFIK
ncbi:MAG: DUF2905 domain-containing protein [Spirochaetes bacterium]|nr:DUF2905 domain-containing protein [Spirochaetota bacterium]